MPAGRVRMGAGLAVALLMTTTVGVAAGAGATGTSGPASAQRRPPPMRRARVPPRWPSPAIDGRHGRHRLDRDHRRYAAAVPGERPGHPPGRHRARARPHHHQGQRPAGKHVISQGGGIWAGMSGSPVYIGGKLAGAISYGFSNGPSRIGGMTPARQMAAHRDLLARPRAASAPRSGCRSTCAPTVAREAERVGRPTCRHCSRLSVPVVVSGARGVLRKRLTAQLSTREFGSIKVLSRHRRRPRPARRRWRRRRSAAATSRASSPAATSPSRPSAPRPPSAATRCSASVTR